MRSVFLGGAHCESMGDRCVHEGVKVILLRAGESLDILGIQPAKFYFKPSKSQAYNKHGQA